jgi:hypothetical protein
LLAAFTLTETSEDELEALWAKDPSVNIFGVHIDLATECDGKPCNYPELAPYGYGQAELAGPHTDKVPLVSLVDVADCKNGLCSGLGECDTDLQSGSRLFCMSDEEWEENFEDEEKDAAFEEEVGAVLLRNTGEKSVNRNVELSSLTRATTNVISFFLLTCHSYVKIINHVFLRREEA